PAEEQVYDVALSDATLTSPQVTAGDAGPGDGGGSGSSLRLIALVAVGVLVVVGIIAAAIVRGRRQPPGRR
ncbi:MAG: hypothetical protein ACR2JK_08770, partial [Geodermatophilaceae bacterium]